MSFSVPERFRIKTGALRTTAADGNNGAFFVPTKPGHPPLRVIASDGVTLPDDADDSLAGWEHVSVSLPHRCPTWEEMCAIKELFWGLDLAVVQFHPPKAVYVNNHPYCLHLWRRVGSEFELPPRVLVGV